jgi:inorganic phosphate transporter, PiT family
MGLIMLILIGVVPTAFALNRTPDANYLQTYKTASASAGNVLGNYIKPGVTVAPGDAKAKVAEAVRTRTWTDETTPALKQLIEQTSGEVSPYGSVADVPPNIVTNTRNDMYLTRSMQRIDISASIRGGFG